MRRIDNYQPVPGEENKQQEDNGGNNMPPSESIPMKTLYAADGSDLHPHFGPYFSDGKRRVDYVLAYQIQKPNTVRKPSPKFGENNFIRRLRRSISMRSSRAPLQPKEDPEITAQEHQTDYHEDDKRFRRDEYEENLLETGLELEKDEGPFEAETETMDPLLIVLSLETCDTHRPMKSLQQLRLIRIQLDTRGSKKADDYKGTRRTNGRGVPQTQRRETFIA